MREAHTLEPLRRQDLLPPAELWRRALIRIATAVVVMGALLGGVDYWIEVERVDDTVVDLARQEAHRFVGKMQDKTSVDLSAPQMEAAVRSAILDHFPIVELYDRERKKRLEVTAPGKEWVEQALKGKRHGFPDDGSPLYHRIKLDHRVFIQVIIPMDVGFFEGVYELDDRTLQDINRGVMRAVLTVFFSVVATGLVLFPLLMGLNKAVLRGSKALLAGNIELMEVLGSAIAMRDSDTNAHNYRVTLYSIELARQIPLPDEDMRALIAGAFLHDVGKIGIPDAILLKPGKLDADEYAVMQTHVVQGGQVLDRSAWLDKARDVVLNHHEKYDGSGYPCGLAGAAIPITARIFAIVDVFDALTSKRPYKEPMSLEKALEIITRDAGSHFDPELVTAFARIAPAIHEQIKSLSDAGVEYLLKQAANHYYGLD